MSRLFSPISSALKFGELTAELLDGIFEFRKFFLWWTRRGSENTNERKIKYVSMFFYTHP